ncbi:MAG TPA: M20/M25/M40 family metallo-hydrolase [Pyrinomonadaceae bacterium]|nr:M20/M25/M40 family metallo-hydrolase [Pyrinomonadaceae bacterium]
MIRRQLAALVLLLALLAPYAALAQQPQPQQPQLDPNDPIAKIRDEGLNRSQVMQTLSYLSDVIGPRLTASPNMKRANEWTRDTLTKWGLQNGHLEAWGPFGRGWSLKRFSAQVIEPQGIPVIAYPKAWSPSIEVVSETAVAPSKKKNAPMVATEPSHTLTAEVVLFDAKDEADLARFKGQLKGKIVLTAPMREVKAHFEPLGTRRDEKNLLTLADAPLPRPQGRGGFGGNRNADFIALQQFNAKKLQFFQDEGAAVLIDPGRGDGGTIFVQQAAVPQPFQPPTFGAPAPNAPRRINAYDKDAPKFAPQIVMAVEHYNRIARMIQAGEKVKMAIELAVEFQDQDLNGYNTVAEIPGSDPTLKDEIVMLGGHMDSWHAGTGATDNGAGVAVAMEAVRIIQTLGLKPKRTIRIALWTGEEEGLLGSRAYVAQHFGKMETPATTAGNGDGTTPPAPVLVKGPEYDKLAGYFNLDNGTGKIRGVYLQANEPIASLFRQWLMPFRDLGAATLSLSNTGGTDHLSFDGIGLPGFQFIQDEIEYDTRTHHSNMDVFDRVQGDDMKQAATIMAAFVYNTAMRDEKLPKKPMAR